MAEYYAKRNCSLALIGDRLDTISYALAFPRGSPLVRNLSHEILKLQAAQTLASFYDEWWAAPHDCAAADTDDSKKSSVSSLELLDVGGVFLVLVIGLLTAALASVAERYCKPRLAPLVRVRVSSLLQ